jgi:putative hydrolase of HD superfamily
VSKAERPHSHRIEAALKFFFEVGYLKRLPRSGWLLAGALQAESVAEHAFRTAVIGYVLATLEGADPFRTAVICLFHDLPETRTTDIHPIAKRYIDKDVAEKLAISEAYESLDTIIPLHVTSLISEYTSATTREAVIARDADLLECILQAHEYRAAGMLAAGGFVRGENALDSYLITSSAKALARRAKGECPNEWWETTLKLASRGRREAKK